jgi:hypothetical protein
MSGGQKTSLLHPSEWQLLSMKRHYTRNEIIDNKILAYQNTLSINQATKKIHRPPPANSAAAPPPTSGDISSEPKKKKKIDPATGGGRDPPQRPGGEIRPPSLAMSLSSANQCTKKKKKKKRYIDPATRSGLDPLLAAWGWPRSTLTARGREIRPLQWPFWSLR